MAKRLEKKHLLAIRWLHSINGLKSRRRLRALRLTDEPDDGYYVGMNLPSILHPQTLLAYEMNGAPLTLQHGAPLRLVTTTKYGIKQTKRITDERPADYWGERGYDWYSGH